MIRCKIFGWHSFEIEAISKHTTMNYDDRPTEHYSVIIERCHRCGTWKESRFHGHFDIVVKPKEEDSERQHLRKMSGLD